LHRKRLSTERGAKAETSEVRVGATTQNIAPKIMQNNFPNHIVCDFGISLFAVNKAVVGIHVLSTRPLFGGGILRRFLPNVPPVK
jgi:hypothetical protein